MRELVGSCHCGAVRFLVRTDLTDPVCCNCSLCARRGAVLHNVPPGDLQLVRGTEALRHYRFNTHTVTHSFCGTCGVFTFFHSQYEGENMYVVNVGCLDGVDSLGLRPRLVNGAAF